MTKDNRKKNIAVAVRRGDDALDAARILLAAGKARCETAEPPAGMYRIEHGRSACTAQVPTTEAVACREAAER